MHSGKKFVLGVWLFPVLGLVPTHYAMADGWFSGANDAAPNAYEQRYGGGFAPLPAAQQKTTSIGYMPNSANAVTATQPSALPDTPHAMHYQQSFNNETPVDDTHKRAELNISSFYDNDPSSDVNGGSTYGIETDIYSRTLDDKWRLFAGELFMNEQEPFGEGHVNYSRTKAGVEYSQGYVTASLAPTFNNYNGNQRVGAAGDISYIATKNWEFGGNVQLFSRDTPLRALNAGITANSYNLNADWYQKDVRNIRVDADFMTFSDDNLRTAVSGTDTEHLYQSSRFNIDGLGTLSESNNSKDNNRDYFNPGQDVLGLAGLRITQPLYKNNDITYEHSLEAKPGVYWQQDYGSSAALAAAYTQHVIFNDDIDASLGLNFTRQDADGSSEDDLTVIFGLNKKL